jgi:hypothetical protein
MLEVAGDFFRFATGTLLWTLCGTKTNQCIRCVCPRGSSDCWLCDIMFMQISSHFFSLETDAVDQTCLTVTCLAGTYSASAGKGYCKFLGVAWAAANANLY